MKLLNTWQWLIWYDWYVLIYAIIKIDTRLYECHFSNCRISLVLGISNLLFFCGLTFWMFSSIFLVHSLAWLENYSEQFSKEISDKSDVFFCWELSDIFPPSRWYQLESMIFSFLPVERVGYMCFSFPGWVILKEKPPSLKQSVRTSKWMVDKQRWVFSGATLAVSFREGKIHGLFFYIC